MVRDIADGLLARGHHPRLITSHPGASSTTVEDGLEIYRSRRVYNGRLSRRMYEDYLTHVPASYLSLVRGHDDIAQALHPPDALAAARWGRRTGKPSILSYVGVADRGGLVHRRKRLEITLRALDECDAVVGLSDYVRESFWRSLGREVLTIAPGTDLEMFRPAAARSEHPTIFCGADVGQERKRVHWLVEALPALRREHPELRLLLSRPRDPRTAERLAATAEGVEFVDVDDREHLARAYGEAWISALPSFGEAFGLVLVESLACGTPVVATAGDGKAEIVDRDSIGRVFDDELGVAGLTSALLEALELSAVPETVAACRARAGDFSLDATTDAYLALYRQLLEARG